METIQINEPVFTDIVIRKTETDVCFTTSDGQKEYKVFLKDDSDSEMMSFSFGDTSNIRWGGTDNWGKDNLPIILGSKAGETEGDSVFVNTIKLESQTADWCKCTISNNGSSVIYTTLSDNQSEEQRTIYFTFSTQDTVVNGGFNKGRPVASQWTVTVIQEGSNVQPVPETDFETMLSEFSDVISSRHYPRITDQTPMTKSFLESAYNRADKEWNDASSVIFSPESYPEVCDYHGTNSEFEPLGYKAMQSWLMAMCLSELCAEDSAGGKDSTNTQTELFKLAYEIGGGRTHPIYGDYTLKGDVFIARLAASAVYTLNHNDYDFQATQKMRQELGSKCIDLQKKFSELNFWDPATGYDNPFWHAVRCQTSSVKVPSEVIPGYNDTLTRSLDRLGYTVNTNLIFPYAPGPEIARTNAANNAHPSQQGQPSSMFNQSTGNYIKDEEIDRYMTDNWNMMDSTLLSDWQSYPEEKKERLIQAAATVSCTPRFMFWPESKVDFNGLQDYAYGSAAYKIFRFSAGSSIKMTGPFSIHGGTYPYRTCSQASLSDYVKAMTEIESQKTPAEHFIDSVTIVADNMRYPTYCEQYGRRRPGCADNLNGHPGRSSVPGNRLNEIYNMDISQMVADNSWGTQKSGVGHEDGVAADSPASYPSGHSSQIWTLAMILASMDPDNIQTYMSEAYKYSVNRSIARFHWNSDCMYGRLFGTITLPILYAMSAFEDGYKALKSAIENPEGSDMKCDIAIVNNSSTTMKLNGEMCLVLANPDRNGVYHGWQGCYNRSGHIRFASGSVSIVPGETRTFSNVSMENSEVVVRGRSPLDPSKLAEAKRASNVMLYDTDGVSETYVPQNMSPDIIFTDGSKYTITYGNGTPAEDDWKVSLHIKNMTGQPIASTGEVRLYIGGHDTGINVYLPGAQPSAGALWTFAIGDNDFSNYDIHCQVNGGTIDDSYNGKALDKEARIYDSRHWNSSDCGWNVNLDFDNPACDRTLKKSGATYYLIITNK